jgi:TctA family transporter
MLEALSFVLAWENIALLAIGTLVGTFVALLPGIGGTNAMALLLPLTFALELESAIPFLVTIMAATGFGGAITSILINLPGDGVNAATTLDGHPLAQQGRAGEALGAAAAASALGAILGGMVLLFGELLAVRLPSGRLL